jgi:hypothetical protein
MTKSADFAGVPQSQRYYPTPGDLMKTSLTIASVAVGFTLLFAACSKDKKPAAKPGDPAKTEPAKDDPKPEPEPVAPAGGGGW